MIREKTYVVYCHTAPNGKKYVGLTGQSAIRRWNNGNGYRTNKHLRRAIEKYGWDAFSHEVLAGNLSEGEAKALEIKLIREFHSDNPAYGYNVSPGGEALADITKKRISAALSGRPGRKLTEKEKELHRARLLGSHLSDETKRKISLSRMGAKLSDNHRTAIREHNKGKHPTTPVVCLDTGVSYPSLCAAAEDTGLCISSIRKVCRGERSHTKGTHWAYQEDAS